MERIMTATPEFETTSNKALPNCFDNKDARTRTLHPMVTGTSVLGLKYNGGVVIAADMLGSYGSLARFPNVPRLYQVNENTVIGASGDYADFQFLSDILEIMMNENDCLGDGHPYTPESIFSWLTRFMYSRRSKFNPIWNTIVVAGHHNGKSFLGYVDKLGTAFQDNSIASGFGAHLGRPLLRDALEKNQELTKEKAVKSMMDCLKVLYYRDARSLNRFQIAVLNDEGIVIESGLTLDTNWEIAHMIQPDDGYNATLFFDRLGVMSNMPEEPGTFV